MSIKKELNYTTLYGNYKKYIILLFYLFYFCVILQKMKKITEDDIELLAIELLKEQGFQYFYGLDVAPDKTNSFRSNYEEVLLNNQLQSAIERLNPNIPVTIREEAFNEIKNISSESLIVGNETFHEKMIEGVKVLVRKGSENLGNFVRLIDFENPENNEYTAINQFTVIEEGHNHRPDIVLFINGLPLVVIELKNHRDKKATIQSAYRQLQTYKKYIPSLFVYNSVLVISDGLSARAGSLSAGMDRFMAWKSANGKQTAC